MYEGFSSDLRRALDQGEDKVADYIRDTAQARGIDPWALFEATARQRLAWERDAPSEPRRSSRRRSRRPRRERRGQRLVWPFRRGRSPLRRLVATTSGAAGRAVGRASRRLIKVSTKAARRHTKRFIASSSQAMRRTAARWGEYAYGLGHWLVHRRWPAAVAKASSGRRALPHPSPAVQALLDGYSFRESVYLFGERDPSIRDPADDWPGALNDFHQAVRNYVKELVNYGGSQ